MATDESVNIDGVIEQLLEVRKHPRIDKVELKENDIRLIVHKAREIFLNQPVLLELGLRATHRSSCFKSFLTFFRSSIENLW